MTVWQKVQSILDEMANTLGLRGLTLASEDGLELMSTGQVDGEWIAAMCPVLNSPSGNSLRHQLNDYKERKGVTLQVFNMVFGGQSLFLCAAGREDQMNVPEMNSFLQKINAMLERVV